MKIILLTDKISGRRWAYRSIAAALADIENPIDVTARRWSQIVKEKGYPFSHSGVLVELLHAKGMKEVNAENPPVL